MNLAGGHWVRWNAGDAASVAGSTALTSSQAARVDRKLDETVTAAGFQLLLPVSAGAAAGNPDATAAEYFITDHSVMLLALCMFVSANNME